MIKIVIVVLALGYMSLMLNADEGNMERNDIKRSEAFWKLYTDALRGEQTAQFEIGVMFERGIGVELNQTQAAKWYEKAAIQGHKDAQYNIGIMYAAGRGIEQNDQFAMMWLASAAKQGDKESRTLLLALVDGKGDNSKQSSNSDKSTIMHIKAVRFKTKDNALVCSSLNDEGQCSRLNESRIFTSKSKQGNYYKISGIATGHGWEAYKGDGWIEGSMIELQ